MLQIIGHMQSLKSVSKLFELNKQVKNCTNDERIN